MIVQLGKTNITIETDNFNKRGMRKWINWLRSGRFKRGTKFLCRKVNGVKRHCCIGVLIESLGHKPTFYDDKTAYYETLCAESVLEKRDGDYDKVCNNWEELEVLQGFLIGKNDICKWSFNKIADWLEETFLK